MDESRTLTGMSTPTMLRVLMLNNDALKVYQQVENQKSYPWMRAVP
jgi:hypothetical protein